MNMKSFIEEFKGFAMRGNVVDLAVAVVIGAAFGKIVSSLVDNIVTPLVGQLMGGIDFTSYALNVGDASITYGKFIQSVFDFVIVAFVIFLVVKAMNKMKEKEEIVAIQTAEPSEVKKCSALLQEVVDILKKNHTT